MSLILVTGATGNVGSEVVRLLHLQGHMVRAAVHDAAAARRTLGNDVEHVYFDFGQPATYQHALQGVSKMFLLRPPALSDSKRYMSPVIGAAKHAGVEHIVFLSLLGAEKNVLVPHHAIEEYLQATNVPWTFLRASFFMQNLSTTHRADIREHNQIYLPAGKGKTSFVDARDVAAVAVKTLTQQGHAYRAYPLTGSEALTYSNVSRIFTEELGLPIMYCDSSILSFARRMRQSGLPLGFILVMIAIYTTARFGLAARITPDTATLLQREPITMRRFVADYRDCWL